MKRFATISITATLLLLTGFIFLRAEIVRNHGWCGRAWHRTGPLSYLGHQLNLSDAQEARIRTMWNEEQPVLAANIQELLAENKELNDAADTNNPDQNAIQKIAERQAATLSALLKEKAQLQSEIFSTVLNTEQRENAIELQHKLESRMDHFAHRLETQPR